MAVKFSNNAKTTISGSLTTSATSIGVADASNFPTLGAGDYTYATIAEAATPANFEIVKVTGISSNTLTIVRAQQGTSARSFSTNDLCELRVTSGLMEEAIDEKADLADLSVTTAAAGTAALSYNSTSGVFTFTPPDLSSYLTSVALNDVSDVTITSATNGQVLKYNGSAWVNDTDSGGIALTDLSVTQNSSGTAALSYNSSTGVFSYTPPDLSSYLTSYTETDTLATVTSRGATTSTNSTFSGTLTVGDDFTVDTDTLFVDASSNQIAFGTTTPATNYDLTIKDPNGTASSEAIAWKFDVSGGGTVRTVDIDFVGFSTGSIGLSGSAAGGTFLENATGGCGISAKANGTVGLYTNGSITSPDVVLDGSGNLDISANVIVDGFVEADSFRTASGSTTALTLTATGGATVGENLTVTGNFTSTGIDDNATSTAITIDSSQNVGIGDGAITSTLDVHSTTASSEISVEGSGGKWMSLVSGTGTTGPMVVFDNSSTRFRIASGADKQGSGVTEIFTVNTGGVTFEKAIEEQQYSLTGTVIDPSNGTIQYKTLGANTTFTESLADGEYVTLMIDDGAGYTVTWPTTTWVGGSAPTLETTGYNVIELWQVNGTLYGAFVGAA